MKWNPICHLPALRETAVPNLRVSVDILLALSSGYCVGYCEARGEEVNWKTVNGYVNPVSWAEIESPPEFIYRGRYSVCHMYLESARKIEVNLPT